MATASTVAIIGAGNLGSALIAGLIEAGEVRPESLTAADASETQRAKLAERFPALTVTADNHEAAEADIVILAVKPYMLTSVLEEIADALGPEQVLVSLAAGTPIWVLEDAFEDPQPIVRVMPNIAMTVQASASALCRNTQVDDACFERVISLFAAVGETVVVDEDQMHAVTGLSGSGPAYVFTLLEALAAGGVKTGLKPEVAQRLAAQTMLGAAKMALESGLHPAALRDMVTTPAGTTIAGLHEIELGGVRGALMSAVEAAAERSLELSNPDHEH